MRALWIVPGLALLAPLSAPQLNAQERDFLLKKPQVTFSIRGGYSVPRAGSGDVTESLWDFTRRHLTVETGDLAGPHVSAEVGIRTSERLDIVFGLGYSASSTLSEFRDYVGEDDLPIAQTTEFTTAPVTVGLKAYLLPRGRSIGSFAWVPRNLNAFAGIAGGMVWYRFEQYGEFVDDETYEIFIDNLRSVERAPTVQFFTGMDVGINNRVMLTTEARYGFAKGPVQYDYSGYSDFEGFSKLDLAGLQLSAGISLRL
jgi:hypothetical protein